MKEQQYTNKLEPIYFIVGPGRSGTTLLMMLLNNHNDAIASPEIKHILYFHDKYKHTHKFTKEVKEDFVHYFKELKAAALNPLFNFQEEKIYEIDENLSYPEFCLEIHKLIHDYKPAKVIVDKNPFYTFYLEKLLQIYPNANFIFLVRDYRGFIHSHLKSTHSFQKTRTLRFYATSWNEYIRSYLNFKKVHNERILLVKMEDFMSNPKDTLGEICRFLTIDFDENIFNYKIKIEQHLELYNEIKDSHPRLYKKMTDLLKPISNENLSNWTKNLKEKDSKIADEICSKLGTKLGYFPITNSSKIFSFYNSLINLPWVLMVKLYVNFIGVRIHHHRNIKRRISFNKKIMR